MIPLTSELTGEPSKERKDRIKAPVDECMDRWSEGMEEVYMDG